MTAALDAPPCRRRRPLVLAGLLLAALTAGFVGYCLIRSWHNRSLLSDAIAAVEREDPHWRWPDLEAGREAVPEAEDSVPLVLHVRHDLAERDNPLLRRCFAIQEHLPPNVPLTDDEYLTLVDLFERQESVVSLLHRLADQPRGRSPREIDPDGGPGTRYINDLGRIHYSAAPYLPLLHVHEGDTDGAMQAALGLLNLYRSVGDDPLFPCQAQRAIKAHRAVACIERALAFGAASDAALAKAQVLFADEAEHPGWRIGLRGHRWVIDDLLARTQAGKSSYAEQLRRIDDPDGSGGPPTRWTQYRDWLRDRVPLDLRRDRAWWLTYTTDLIRHADRTFPEQADHLRELHAGAEAAPAIAQYYALRQLEKSFLRFQLAQARCRCAAAALAVERHRLKTGQWPGSLTDVMTPVPLDPYDGAPLRYRRLPDGVAVYAVGPDRTDDGGRFSLEQDPPTGTDVGFRLWDVSKRRQSPSAEPAP
jgi:hypothetical protein